LSFFLEVRRDERRSSSSSTMLPPPSQCKHKSCKQEQDTVRLGSGDWLAVRVPPSPSQTKLTSSRRRQTCSKHREPPSKHPTPSTVGELLKSVDVAFKGVKEWDRETDDPTRPLDLDFSVALPVRFLSLLTPYYADVRYTAQGDRQDHGRCRQGIHTIL
jgi:hypothetical protein